MGSNPLHVVFYLFPDLPGCNLDMVLDLPCSGGSGGVGIVVVAVDMISSSGMVGHEVKVLLPASEGVPEAPEVYVIKGQGQRTFWLQ